LLTYQYIENHIIITLSSLLSLLSYLAV